MPIDPYAPCPGGTGKKVKFCCSDLIAELDKVQRMLDGEQRAACLEYIEGLEPKFPERACLLSIRAMLEAQLGQEDKAEATLARFVEKYPGNPVALAERATLLASEEGGTRAIGLLQDAIEKCDDQFPPQIYDAIGFVAHALIADRQFLPARAHLMLQIGLSAGKDKQPLELLGRLNSSPSLPLWAKQDFPLLPPPDDALWKNSFTKTMEPAFRGAWRLTERNLVDLAKRVGDWQAIWHNIAVLRTWLADASGAAEAWRKYAQQDISHDDAVEGMAMAQLLDADAVDKIDVLTVTYTVNDTESLQARLTANSRSPQMPIDLAPLAGENEPPPKGAYWLLDRPIPPSAAELQREQIPRVVGQVFLFGKQTDRAARMELVTYRTELAAAKSVVAEIGGDAVGTVEKEEVTTSVPALEHKLSWNWRLPKDVSLERRLALMNEEREDILFNRWPEMPQKRLGGKSAAELARDPAARLELLAEILILELSTDRSLGEFDFNRLRQKLGLPTLEMMDPDKARLPQLPLLRYARIDVKKLSDEALLDLFKRAEHYHHNAALRPLAQEVIARESLDKKIEKDTVHGVLAQIEPDVNEAFRHLERARAAAESAGRSTAPWDLSELAIRITRGDVAEADRLLHHIRESHIREPGVAQALFQILSEAGIIGPDGRPTMPPGRESPGIAVPGAAPSEPSKIWTPGSEQAASGKKSALWTPGME